MKVKLILQAMNDLLGYFVSISCVILDFPYKMNSFIYIELFPALNGHKYTSIC